MLGSRAWRALMRRNMVYRVRNWFGTILEIILPIGFVGVLVGIKSAVQGTSSFAPQVIPAIVPSNEYAFTPLTFADYVTALQVTRTCVENSTGGGGFEISGMPQQGYNWQVPFVKCDYVQCTTNGQSALPFCEFGRIGVAPINSSDAGGMERAVDFQSYIYDMYPQVQSSEMPFDFEFVQVFGSQATMDQYVTNDSYGTSQNPKLIMGIVFTGNDPGNYVYSLRQNSTNFNNPAEQGRPVSKTTPNTATLFAPYAKSDYDVCAPQGGTADQGPLQNSCTGQYVYNGILTFQRLVGDYILNRTGAASQGFYVSEGGSTYVQFPTRTYTQNGFYATIQVYGPLLVTLGLLYPVAAMITYIVREKELRQKELMKMMSVSESDIGWAWFISFFWFNLIVLTITAGVSVILYENSQPFYLWIFWLFTFLAVVVYCMCCATLTSKTTRGVLIGLLIFFIGVFLTLAVDYQTGSSGVIAIISLHPVAAFSYGLQAIGSLEDLGVGVNGATAGYSDGPSGYSFNSSIYSLIIDSILWGLVTFYLNRVIPPDFGQALPWYFPFTLSFWCPGSAKAPKHADSNDEEENDDIPNEPVGNLLLRQKEDNQTIEIHKLRMQFGKKTAVADLNLSIYSGQITALLGHNGAGKTTTISCLTGALKPTSGFATIAGKDSRTQMQQIRQELGICLQQDCLFPLLTVREHIQFFSRIKGLYATSSYKEAEEHVDQAIRDVALFEKRNTTSSKLSGGMMRKLSVAIAFCGGSKIVFLDEPTSGMDPFSRRFTWNVIRNYRQDRCIILTTHFMDEADILGDRIAIMAEGQLRCVGSSLFLKKTYGVGYQLTIEKKKVKAERDDDDKEEGTINDAVDDKAAFTANDERLKKIVTGAVHQAALLNNVGSELSYQLPLGAASSFAPMFEGLDKEVERGVIVTYGVSITTLDEVFLLVARGESKDKSEFASSTFHIGGGSVGQMEEDKSYRSRMDLENEGLFRTHLGALFKKRAAIFKRDKRAWVCTTILPSLFVLIGFIIFRFASPVRNMTEIQLSLQPYNAKVVTPPQNPIPFNEPNQLPYTCQPGRCSYQPATNYLLQTGEIYYYCGYRGRILEPLNCSISESALVTGELTEFGAKAEAARVGNVLESSLSVNATSELYAASQYGAIFFSHDSGSFLQNGSNYSELVTQTCFGRPSIPASSCSGYSGTGNIIQYNYTALHVSPLYQALANEALVRAATGNAAFQIQSSIYPLPITAVEASLGAAEDAFSAWFLVILSFPFIAGAFVTFVVAEKKSKAKHLQTVAGVETWAYWLSTYMWDILNYQIPLWITVILMFAFQVNSFTTSSQQVVGGVIVVLFLFGPAAAGFSYCISFLFQSAALANMAVIIFSFLIGLGGPLAQFILRLIGSDPTAPQQNLVNAANIVSWVLRIFPSFCLGNALFNAINIASYNYLEGKILSAWSGPILLYEVIFLAVESVAYITLAVYLDKWSANPRFVAGLKKFIACVTCRLCSKSKERESSMVTALVDDDDVLAEQDRVLKGEANNDLIVLSQLTKMYDNGKLAVNNLSFGIPSGECFGLLGINGAGKTTVMQMLTAEFPPTSGDATLAGFSVRNQPEKTRRRIGYCPQFDAHFDNMTGREHVELYAAIKGVPKQFVKDAAASKLREVGLSVMDSDRLSAEYSGGMKRRLSLACATIGQPQIMFLDECSTGVDPVARREIWQLISDMVTSPDLPEEERPSIILTTHSMEECEALCPRIAIMANGRLRCLGSAQHLKTKFGQGFQVELKVALVNPIDDDYVANAAALARIMKSEEVAASIVASAASASFSVRSSSVPVPGGGAIPASQPDIDVADGGSDSGDKAGDPYGPSSARSLVDESAPAEHLLFNLDQLKNALRTLTGDDSLANMIAHDNVYGYTIWKDAVGAIGAPLSEVAVFCTEELRMRELETFVSTSYPNHVLRERQDTKARYEVSSVGVRLSEIFANIEGNKDRLRLSDYGVSQTSLEQVFNMHAAEAERLKHGRNDG